MSILRKTPFIETLLGQLSVEELARLQTVSNSTATPERVTLFIGDKTLPSSAPATVANKIKIVDFFISPVSHHVGILIYHSTSYCVLVGTESKDGMIPFFKIDVANRKAIPVNEFLSVEEFRRCLDDSEEAAPGGKDAWVEKMKEVLDYDEEDEEVQVGTDLYVDGETKVNKFGAWSGDSRKIDFNPTNDTTSFYGHVKVGSAETLTSFDVKGTSTFGGNIHNTSGFIESSQLKVDNITFHDTPEGQTPAVNIVNADLKIGATGQTKKLYLNGIDISVPESVTTSTAGSATSISLKFWQGTQAQYDSISTKDTNTLYLIKE